MHAVARACWKEDSPTLPDLREQLAPRIGQWIRERLVAVAAIVTAGCLRLPDIRVQLYMVGAVDRTALAVLGLGLYMWMPATYSRDRPLREWAFVIPLPLKTVENMLVHDFRKNAQLWVDNVQSVTKTPHGSLLSAGQFDMVTQFQRRGAHTFEQSNKCSPLVSGCGRTLSYRPA